MIQFKDNNPLQQILTKYPHQFLRSKKLQNYRVKLNNDKNIDTEAKPQRFIQYHLQDRVNKVA